MTYEEQRAKLYAQAQENITNGNLDEANRLMNEIKKLDANHEEQLNAQANLDALNGERTPGANAPKLFENQGVKLTDGGAADNSGDITNSVEYRTAFMKNFLNDIPMPEKFRNEGETTSAVTTSATAGTTVPTTLYEQIIVKLEAIGEIYARIFRANFPTSIVIPTADILPEAEWVDEDKGGTEQKYTTDKVVFHGYKLTCKTAFSLFMSVTALEIFEAQFVEFVSKAMVKAVEKAALTGSGNGCPKGILTETPPEGQALTVAKTGKLTYQLICEAEAALPAAYDGAVWLMTKKTFFAFMGITDQNGQPVARLNAGLNGKPDSNLLGRHVCYTDGIMKNYAETVSADTLFAAIFDLRFFVFNEVMGMFVKKYVDDDTDNLKIKATMLADGKTVDKNSLVTITKKAS